MRQLIQSFSDGRVELIEVPVPQARAQHLVIRSACSLVSVGTERMLIQFGRSGLIDKARQQPERVKMVLDKVKTDGLLTTWDAVKSKLEHPTSLGYSNAGTVVAVGEGVQGFKVGDRVVSNGPHAEFASVPHTLCAKIPDNVPFESACFTVVAAVGLQGIRLAQPTLGESFMVIGLGLIGMMTAQMLRAQGVRVLGVDIDASRCEEARSLGIETLHPPSTPDSIEHAWAFSRGRGLDGVLITASTQSSEPIQMAAKCCRQKGRIVLVGVADIHIDRTEFYNKELSFQVSCSYGPGRYDVNYEQKGQDYPLGFVRWTAQRNFEAVLELMSQNRLTPSVLIDHRIDFSRAREAYEDSLLATARGIVLQYESSAESASVVALSASRSSASPVVVGLIGAGNYTAGMLAKTLQDSSARLKTIVSPGALNATLLGRKFGFEQVSSSADSIFSDPEINVVVISVRHDLHVPYAIQALKAGKHVFIEKPLAVNNSQLRDLIACYENLAPESRPRIMIGFNRRFAPFIQDAKRALNSRLHPLHVIMTVNAGALPDSHWAHDMKTGGGRLIGEACHFVDLARHLVGHPICGASAEAIPSSLPSPDALSARLKFTDGSLATILYLSNGAKSFPKERIEIFCGGGVLQIDNFRTLKSFNWKSLRSKSSWRQNKGHLPCWMSFVKEIESSGDPTIPFGEMIEVTENTFRLHDQLIGKTLLAEGTIPENNAPHLNFYSPSP